MTDGTFAIKRLKCDIEERSNTEQEFNIEQGFDKKSLSDARAEFEAEVEILRRFSGDTHPHLVSLLAAFQHGKDYYLLFHWAKSDLLRFWMKISPVLPLKRDNLEWMIRQCRGIADGLQHIHDYQMSNPPMKGFHSHLKGDTAASIQIFGRHGDIKPENVLLYKNNNDSSDRGVLKITDFGLARFHSEKTRSNIRKSRLVATTPTYRPPECDMDDGKISRSFDIWSLGCVFLEFIAWHLGGWPSLNAFAQSRKAHDIYGFNSDQFFEIVKVKGMKELVAARVKLEVIQVRFFFYIMH
jgi:serine/threonine protein kinase